jgi:hypothetical protein
VADGAVADAIVRNARGGVERKQRGDEPKRVGGPLLLFRELARLRQQHPEALSAEQYGILQIWDVREGWVVWHRLSGERGPPRVGMSPKRPEGAFEDVPLE